MSCSVYVVCGIIYQSVIALLPPALDCVDSPFAVITAPIDCTRPLKGCCGSWHQYVSSTSLKSCKLRGWASTYQSSTSHRCSIEVRSKEFGSQVNTFFSTILLFCHYGMLNHPERKRLLLPGNTVSMNGCTCSAAMLR